MANAPVTSSGLRPTADTPQRTAKKSGAIFTRTLKSAARAAATACERLKRTLLCQGAKPLKAARGPDAAQATSPRCPATPPSIPPVHVELAACPIDPSSSVTAPAPRETPPHLEVWTPGPETNPPLNSSTLMHSRCLHCQCYIWPAPCMMRLVLPVGQDIDGYGFARVDVHPGTCSGPVP